MSNTNEIGMFMHCRRCLLELPINESPAGYARLAMGFTPVGVQVWCERHDINVVHIDFEGAVHPADMTAEGDQ